MLKRFPDSQLKEQVLKAISSPNSSILVPPITVYLLQPKEIAFFCTVGRQVNLQPFIETLLHHKMGGQLLYVVIQDLVNHCRYLQQDVGELDPCILGPAQPGSFQGHLIQSNQAPAAPLARGFGSPEMSASRAAFGLRM